MDLDHQIEWSWNQNVYDWLRMRASDSAIYSMRWNVFNLIPNDYGFSVYFLVSYYLF